MIAHAIQHPGTVARTSLLALVLTLSPPTITHAAPERIGIYDSRAIAYACFWSDAGTRHRDALIADVRAAKSDDDAARLRRAETALREYDNRNHLAVFSTAPADDALTALAPQIPAIQAEHGVARLVSKWDAAALAAAADAERVDVTAALVAAFALPQAKQHVIDEILAHDPIPIERARALQRAGKL